jgi:hypothetical protein
MSVAWIAYTAIGMTALIFYSAREYLYYGTGDRKHNTMITPLLAITVYCFVGFIVSAFTIPHMGFVITPIIYNGEQGKEDFLKYVDRIAFPGRIITRTPPNAQRPPLINKRVLYEEDPAKNTELPLFVVRQNPAKFALPISNNFIHSLFQKTLKLRPKQPRGSLTQKPADQPVAPNNQVATGPENTSPNQMNPGLQTEVNLEARMVSSPKVLEHSLVSVSSIPEEGQVNRTFQWRTHRERTRMSGPMCRISSSSVPLQKPYAMLWYDNDGHVVDDECPPDPEASIHNKSLMHKKSHTMAAFYTVSHSDRFIDLGEKYKPSKHVSPERCLEFIEKNARFHALANNNPDDPHNICLICFGKTPDAIFMPCGHGGVCYDCALSAYKKKTPTCYICRQVDLGNYPDRQRHREN